MATATVRRSGTGNPKVETRVPSEIADAFAEMAKQGLTAREVVEMVGQAWIDRPDGQTAQGFRERLGVLADPDQGSPEALGLGSTAPTDDAVLERLAGQVRSAASQGIVIGVSVACYAFNDMPEDQVTYLARKWLLAHQDLMREVVIKNRTYRRALSAVTGRLVGEAYMGALYARQLERGVPVDEYADEYKERA